MATVIKLKSGTQNAVPSSLQQGEFAINVDNGNLYYGSGSDNDVKQNISLKTLNISGSQTLETNVDNNTPLVGVNMNSGVEMGTVLVSGSFNTNTWDVNLIATPITNHSLILTIQVKLTKSDFNVLSGLVDVNVSWDDSGNSFVAGVTHFAGNVDLAKVLNVISIINATNTSNANFTAEFPTINSTDCILINWADSNQTIDSSLNDADYEMVINYKVNKY